MKTIVRVPALLAVLAASIAAFPKGASAANECTYGSGGNFNSSTTNTSPDESWCFFMEYGNVNANNTSFALFQEQGGTTYSGASALSATSNYNLGIFAQTGGPYAVAAYNLGSGGGVYGFSPEGNGVVGINYDPGANSAPSVQAGVVGLEGTWPTDSATSMGVFGSASDGDGGHFLTSASGGYSAVYASNTASGTNSTGVTAVSTHGNGVEGLAGGAGAYDGQFGVLGSSNAADGGHFISVHSGSAGVYGTTDQTVGYGVYANNSGGGYGLYAASYSGEAGYFTAVHNGIEVHSTSSTTSYTAIRGIIDNANGTGVSGTTGDSGGYGVEGNNTNGGFGVYGTASGGTLGSGGATGRYAGYFDGVVRVTGELYVSSCPSCTSDIRLKKNVQPLEGAIDKLLELKGITFEWKDPAPHDNDTGRVVGFSAQEVEKIFPSWVKQEGYTAPDGQKYRTLETRQIEALEVESIRYLKTENDGLKADNEALRSRVAKLEADAAKMTSLEDRLAAMERAIAAR